MVHHTLTADDLRWTFPAEEFSDEDLKPAAKDRHGRPGALGQERALVEVRPHAVDKVQLCVCTLPQQEIAEALLAAGADQQVDLRRRQCGVIDCGKLLDETRTVDVVLRPQLVAQSARGVGRRLYDVHAAHLRLLRVDEAVEQRFHLDLRARIEGVEDREGAGDR
jgi:hypothetical protein